MAYVFGGATTRSPPAPLLFQRRSSAAAEPLPIDTPPLVGLQKTGDQVGGRFSPFLLSLSFPTEGETEARTRAFLQRHDEGTREGRGIILFPPPLPSFPFPEELQGCTEGGTGEM